MSCFLYHRVPDDMQGETLYPLNQLKEVYPDAYEDQVKKYEGREELLDAKVLPLDCLWNDVLHFVSVEPRQIKIALEEAGIKFRSSKFFKVNPYALLTDKTCVYLHKYTSRDRHEQSDNWSLYDPDKLDEYNYIPDKTKKYYKEMATVGKQPLLYPWIPHILFRGTLDITKLETISL